MGGWVGWWGGGGDGWAASWERSSLSSWRVWGGVGGGGSLGGGDWPKPGVGPQGDGRGMGT